MGEGQWELLFKEYRIFVWEDEKVLEIESDNGYLYNNVNVPNATEMFN